LPEERPTLISCFRKLPVYRQKRKPNDFIHRILTLINSSQYAEKSFLKTGGHLEEKEKAWDA
jgi:hypothetical protein